MGERCLHFTARSARRQRDAQSAITRESWPSVLVEVLIMGVQSLIINHPDIYPSPGEDSCCSSNIPAPTLITVVSSILGSRLPLDHIAVLPAPHRRQLLRPDLTVAVSTYWLFCPIYQSVTIFFSKFLGCLLLGLLTQPGALPHIKAPPPRPNHPCPQMHPNVPGSATPPLQSQRGDSHTQQDLAHTNQVPFLFIQW